MQVPGDPLPLVQQGRDVLRVPRFGEHQCQGGLGRVGLGRVQVAPSERGRADQPEEHQHPDPSTLRLHGCVQSGTELPHGVHPHRPRPVQGVHHQAVAVPQHRVRAPVRRHQGADQLVGGHAVDDLHHQVVAHPGEYQSRRVGVGHLAGRGRDLGEHVLLLGAGQQHGGDLLARPQPALPAFGRRVELGVLDRDGRRRGEGEHDVVVVVGEAPGLLRQVQVAEDAVAHPDGGAEERAHRRVTRGEAPEAGVAGEVVQAQRAVRRDGAEHPDRVRGPADQLRQALVDAALHEGGGPAPCVQNVDRRKGGTGQVGARRDETLQDRRQVQVRGQGERGLQQVGGRERAVAVVAAVLRPFRRRLRPVPRRGRHGVSCSCAG